MGGVKLVAGDPGGAMGTPNADCGGALMICRVKAGGRLIVVVVIPSS